MLIKNKQVGIVFFRTNNGFLSLIRLIALFVGLLLFFTNQLYTQPFGMRQFTVEDGLPSSFVYDLAQDEEGFIWISTEGGLCRFDGSSFEREPIKESFRSTVVELDVDAKGRLWLTDLTAQIARYSQGGLTWIKDIKPSSNAQFVKHSTDLHGNDWFLTEESIVAYLKNSDGEQDKTLTFEEERLTRSQLILEMPDSSICVISTDGVGKFIDYELSFSPFKEPFSFTPSSAILMGDKILFSVNDKLFSFDPIKDTLALAFQEYSEYIRSEILFLLYEQDNLWISTRLNGLVLIQNLNSEHPVINTLFNGTVVGSIIKDEYDGYWMTTEGDGLFYLPNINTKVVADNKTRRILTAVSTFQSDKIVLGFDDNYIKVIDDKFETVFAGYLQNDGERIYEIVYEEEGEKLWFASSNLCWMDDSYRPSRVRKTSYLKAVRMGEKNKKWFGSSSVAGYVDSTLSRIKVLSQRAYAVLPTGENSAWFGTINGLYFFKNGAATLSPFSDLQKDIHDLQMSRDSTLWIATLGDGVYLYRNDSIVYHFDTDNGLLSNHCTKILLDDQHAWIATNRGVNQILLEDYSVIRTINKDEGLPSVEINDLAKFNDQLLVATNQGLAIFADSTKFGYDPISIHFSNIKIQEKDTAIHDEYELKYSQNNIKIEFTGISLRNADFLKYQYQLEGLEDTWVTTDLGVAQYPSLSSGTYTFRVKTKTINSDWSEEKRIQFYIAKPYWERWWFYLGVALLLGFVVREIFKELRRRNLRKQELKTSQLIALRARMNPHFLFNALNSIQELIIRNDKRSANRYLSRFARLMRTILNMSDKNEVSLQTEIEALELYLSLEALRFEKDFEYQFEIAPEVNPHEIAIPSMLIQPYVENAVIHGLMHRQGTKNLFITFKIEGPYLMVVVEDNGVGRKKAKQIHIKNGRTHYSTGMSLTKNRLELLNSTQKDRLSVVFQDLKNKDGQAAGTRVTIYIAVTQSSGKSYVKTRRNKERTTKTH